MEFSRLVVDFPIQKSDSTSISANFLTYFDLTPDEWKAGYVRDQESSEPSKSLFTATPFEQTVQSPPPHPNRHKLRIYCTQKSPLKNKREKRDRRKINGSKKEKKRLKRQKAKEEKKHFVIASDDKCV